MITRRDMLAAGAAALLASRLPTTFAAQSGNGKRVLVIGGGPAGLCAGYELMKAGCEVQVFEARPVAGGRFMSVREPLADGLHAEGGAMILFSEIIERYIREFELPVVPSDSSWFSTAPVYVRGELVPQLPGGKTRWPDSLGLAEDEQGLTRADLAARYRRGPVGALTEDLDPAAFPFASLAEYDTMTLAEFMRGNGASDAAIELMSIGYLNGVGDGPATYSALSAIAEAALISGSWGAQGPVQIVGGNDRLPAAFASRLGNRVSYSSPVMAIRQDSDGVELTVQTPSGRTQVRGDFAVCAAPFHILKRLELPDSLSPLTRRAIDSLDVTSITRVFLQFSERFWKRYDRSPGGWTDLPIQGVWPTNRNHPGKRGILEIFTGGQYARDIDGMSEEAAIAYALEGVEHFHPEASDYFETGTVVSWDKEPWIEGCQVYFKPGQMHEFFPHLQQPEGRIHFAGDHIWGVPGYAFSALYSAQTVTASILAA